MKNWKAGMAVLLMVSMSVPMTGCVLFQRREVSTPAEQQARNARVVFTAAESAMILALKNKPAEKKKLAAAVKAELDQFVLPVLAKPDTKLTAAAMEILFAKLTRLDPAYKTLLQNGLKTLEEFVKMPTLDDALKPEQQAYVQAFFSGLNSGCEFTLAQAD